MSVIRPRSFRADNRSGKFFLKTGFEIRFGYVIVGNGSVCQFHKKFFSKKFLFQQSCAKVLSTCIPLLNSDHATTLVENEFVNGRLPANFSDFLRQFGLILVNFF